METHISMDPPILAEYVPPVYALEPEYVPPVYALEPEFYEEELLGEEPLPLPDDIPVKHAIITDTYIIRAILAPEVPNQSTGLLCFFALMILFFTLFFLTLGLIVLLFLCCRFCFIISNALNGDSHERSEWRFPRSKHKPTQHKLHFNPNTNIMHCSTYGDIPFSQIKVTPNIRDRGLQIFLNNIPPKRPGFCHHPLRPTDPKYIVIFDTRYTTNPINFQEIMDTLSTFEGIECGHMAGQMHALGSMQDFHQRGRARY